MNTVTTSSVSSANNKQPASSTIHSVLDSALDRLGQLVGSTDKLCDRVGVISRPATAGQSTPAPSNPTVAQKVIALHELLSFIEQNVGMAHEAVG